MQFRCWSHFVLAFNSWKLQLLKTYTAEKKEVFKSSFTQFQRIPHLHWFNKQINNKSTKQLRSSAILPQCSRNWNWKPSVCFSACGRTSPNQESFPKTELLSVSCRSSCLHAAALWKSCFGSAVGQTSLTSFNSVNSYTWLWLFTFICKIDWNFFF